MTQPIQEFLVLCFAAAINFPLLTITMMYLGSADGKKKTIYLLAGSITALLSIGLLILSFPAKLLDLDIHHKFSHEFDYVIGLVLICLGIYNYFRKEKDSENQSKEKAKSAWQCFGTGFLMMVVNLNTLILYIALLKNLAEIYSNDFYRYVLLIVSNIIINLAILLPLILDAISPSKAKKIFGPINIFIQNHRKMIISLLLIIVGGYILYRSVS